MLGTLSFFFFNDTATTEIYTLSLHDALPISGRDDRLPGGEALDDLGERRVACADGHGARDASRSEEHTSELQSQSNLVCRLLLEKKKKLKPPVTELLGSAPIRPVPIWRLGNI